MEKAAGNGEVTSDDLGKVRQGQAQQGENFNAGTLPQPTMLVS